MPTLKIDGQTVTVPPGSTLLAAARALGIELPTLCHYDGPGHVPSCQVCTVRLGTGQFVPACAYLASDGLEVITDAPAVLALRRGSLELLLSDHLGDCYSPCQRVCPAHVAIPQVLRLVREGHHAEALIELKQELALPLISGTLCPATCESGCRRQAHDEGVAIRQIERFLAERDLTSGQPWLPPCAPASGHRVAIVGAGPCGLAAAWYLRQEGHAVTVFEASEQAGGHVLALAEPAKLPPALLAAELALVWRLGAVLRTGQRLGDTLDLATLRAEHELVLLTTGVVDRDWAVRLGLKASTGGLTVNAELVTNLPGVLAAGHAIRKTGKVVHSLADGRRAARLIHARLLGLPAPVEGKSFSVKLGKVDASEMAGFLANASLAGRQVARDQAPDIDQAIHETERCLHCDCRKASTCQLRQLAERYQASATRFGQERGRFRQELRHDLVVFEPGKCIKCGHCIQIANGQAEPMGLGFVGRGFEIQVTPPPGIPWPAALQRAAREAAAACPTGALALRDAGDRPHLTPAKPAE